MSDLIRTDTLFGKRVNLVGNISADLVLESLGKVYIKSRNKALTLEEFITSLALDDPNVSTSRTLVVEGIENLDTSGLKDGTFIYDKLSNILYIYLDEDLIELINVAPEGTGYVKRSGDTMTGRLAIYVLNGPPLYVNSTDLVENLNAAYLNGYSGKEFTKRSSDEIITGRWKFRSPTEFENNVLFSRDIVVNGSVGTLLFASGFGGFGWRMDADTNTLTVDNLVVRKLMHVYELVVNKISATNGSLWVSNAGKVKNAYKLDILSVLTGTSYTLFYGKLNKGDCFIRMPNYELLEVSANPSNNQIPRSWFTNASGDSAMAPTSVLSENALKTAHVVIILDEPNRASVNDFSTDISSSDSDAIRFYSRIPLFDSEFRFNTVFPIITRSLYLIYKSKIDEIKQKLELLKILQDEFNLLNELYNAINRELLQLNAELLLLTDENAISAKLLQILDKTNLLNNKGAELYVKQQEVNTVNSQISALRDEVSDVSLICTFIHSFYKYFGVGDFYLVQFDEEELPVFKSGDLLRCQKWTYNGIKYYDAVVCNLVGSDCIIRVARSVLDYTTTVTYDDSLNPTITILEDVLNTTLYNRSINTDNSQLVGLVEEKDGLVQIGHLWDSLRLNAVYITSTDDGAPFMDVLSGVNRPDYSVIYYVPIYTTIKLNKNGGGGQSIFGEVTIDIPYTGNYYVLKFPETTLSSDYCDYTYVKSGQNKYMFAGYVPINSVGLEVTYLNISPDINTKLGENSQSFYLLTESGGNLILEDGGYILLLEESDNIVVASTRTTRARFGNLDGILDETFPIDKLPYGYGLYGQNVFLTGEFYLNNGMAVADIGKDAITFAIAAQQATNSAIDQIYKDIDSASKILQNNINIFLTLVANDYYGKKVLKSAGMKIANFDDPNNSGLTLPSIVLWGNYIMIATTLEEFDDPKHHDPTLLMHHGIIDANLIRLYSMHSKIGVTGAGTPVYDTYIERAWIDDNEEVKQFKGNVRVSVLWDNDEHDNIVSATMLDDPGYDPEDSSYQDDYHPMYEYMYINGLTGLTESEICRILETYDKYIWAINKGGDGYFARGNFSWDLEGSLTIKGQIILDGETTIGGVQLAKNALLVLDGYDNTVLTIGNFSKLNYREWLNTAPTLYWSIDHIITGSALSLLTKDNLNIPSSTFNLNLHISNYYNSYNSTITFTIEGFYVDNNDITLSVTLIVSKTIPSPLTSSYRDLTVMSSDFTNYTPFTITSIQLTILNSRPSGARAESSYSLYVYTEEGYDYTGNGTSGGSGGNQTTKYFIQGYISVQSSVSLQTQLGNDFIGVSPDENTLFWVGKDSLINLKASQNLDANLSTPLILVSGFRVFGDQLLVCDGDILNGSDLRSIASNNLAIGTRLSYMIRGTMQDIILRTFYSTAPELSSSNLPDEATIEKYVRTIHLCLDRVGGLTNEYTWIRVIHPSDLYIGCSYIITTDGKQTSSGPTTKYRIYIGKYTSTIENGVSLNTLLEEWIAATIGGNYTQGPYIELTNKNVGILTFLGSLEYATNPSQYKDFWKYESYATNN